MLDIKIREEIEFKLLSEHKEYSQRVAELWFEELGKFWLPHVNLIEVSQRYANQHQNQLPLTVMALHEKKVIGIISLREHISRDNNISSKKPWSDLMPWLSGLVVHPQYRKCGIAKQLIENVKTQARSFGQENLYLFTINQAITNFYLNLDWKIIGTDFFYNKSAHIMSIKI